MDLPRCFNSKSEGSDIANIHIYGWGSLWPFPDGLENEYDDGSSINNRITRAVTDGQDVMLTLVIAPSSFRESGIVKHNDGMGNITIKPKEKSNYRFEIINWIDKE